MDIDYRLDGRLSEKPPSPFTPVTWNKSLLVENNYSKTSQSSSTSATIDGLQHQTPIVVVGNGMKQVMQQMHLSSINRQP